MQNVHLKFVKDDVFHGDRTHKRGDVIAVEPKLAEHYIKAGAAVAVPAPEPAIERAVARRQQ